MKQLFFAMAGVILITLMVIIDGRHIPVAPTAAEYHKMAQSAAARNRYDSALSYEAMSMHHREQCDGK